MITFIVCLLARTWSRTWHRLCRNERSGCNQPDAHCFFDIWTPTRQSVSHFASDVLASAVPRYTYGKNKNLISKRT